MALLSKWLFLSYLLIVIVVEMDAVAVSSDRISGHCISVWFMQLGVY